MYLTGVGSDYILTAFVKLYRESYEAIRREWEESREVFNRDDVAEVSTAKIKYGSSRSDV